MKLIEIALAASGRLATNSTFLEIAPAGGAVGAVVAAVAAVTTPATSVAACTATAMRRARDMARVSTRRERPPAGGLAQASARIRIALSRSATCSLCRMLETWTRTVEVDM